jgi:hypothetical protein
LLAIVAPGAQLGPGDFRMDVAGQAAVSPAMTFSRPATSTNVHEVRGQVLPIRYGVSLLTKNDVELPGFRNSGT